MFGEIGLGILGNLLAHPLCQLLDAAAINRLHSTLADRRLASDFDHAVAQSLLKLGSEGAQLGKYLRDANVLHAEEGFELHRLLIAGERPDAEALSRACRRNDPSAPHNLDQVIARWLSTLEDELRPHPELGRKVAYRQISIINERTEVIEAAVREISERLTMQHAAERAADQDTIKALQAAVRALTVQASAAAPTPQIDNALAALREGRTAEAEELFAALETRGRQRLAQLGDEATEAQHEVAEAARHQGALASLFDVEKALAAYRRAAEADPRDAWTWVYIARLERQAGRLTAADEAAVQARQAAAITGADRDELVAEAEVGKIRTVQGRLAQAEEAFAAAKAAAERLVNLDPTNLEWQRDLGVILTDVADLRKTRGDLATALRDYQNGQAIRRRLVNSDPSNAHWQHDLSVSWERIGDIKLAQGDLRGALATYEEGHAIIGLVAGHYPGNSEWQRSLSVSWNKLGDIRTALSDNAGALWAYEQDTAIAARLVASDQANMEWQHDLSISLNKLGDLVLEQHDLARALQMYEEARIIRQHLVEADSRNVEWQRSLSISWLKIGEVMALKRDFVNAISSYEESYKILHALDKLDPSNADWQRDIIVLCVKLAETAEANGDGSGEATYYCRGLQVAETLASQGRLRPADLWMVKNLRCRLMRAKRH